MTGSPHVGQSYPRDRSSRHSLPLGSSNPTTAQLHHASSRSSNNSTSNSRFASHSNNSSSSNLQSPHSPQKTQNYPRLKHSSRASLGSDRPASSRMSRTPNPEDLRQNSPAISSYLQERLRQERRSETLRSGSSRAGSNDTMSTSDRHMQAIQSSPVRASTSDGPRPRSSSGHDAARRKAVGLRASELKLESVLNENFDLKFELSKRRELMPKLEAEVAGLKSTVDKLQSTVGELKSQKKEVEEVNDRLVQELEKRDDAIRDAVAMIVSLEATVEKLQKERDIIRSLSAETYDQLPELEDTDEGALTRMPSFINDPSAKTENLRNAYLAPRASTLSFKRASDSAMHDDDVPDHKLMSTPSLSVLSESSFVSVYGQKPFLNSSSSPPERSMEYETTRNPPATIPRAMTPTRNRRSSSGSASRGPSGTFSIGEVSDHSPLSNLQRRLQYHDSLMLSDLSAANGGTPANQRNEYSSPQLPAMTLEQQQQARQRMKQEKREALRRVMTDGPRDLGAGLPPTPDTISTSTLRRFKNSNDTLSQPAASIKQYDIGPNDRFYPAATESTNSRSSSQTTTGEATSQAASMSAFNGRKGLENSQKSLYTESQSAIPLRPRSAGETTTSDHRRDENGWASDSSEDDNVNDGATVSTYDYWMREGLKPNRTFPHNAAVNMDHGADVGGRVSPDLFAFPGASNGSGGWSSEAMFGNLGGAGFLGAGTTSPPTTHALDAIGASLPSPQAGFFGSGLASPGPSASTTVPPPPRRSSLHARTGSSPAVTRPPSRQAPANGKLRKSPVRSGMSRSNSVDYSDQAPPTPTLASPPTGSTPDPSKRHYPPISGSQQQHVRRLSGLNLFRRSTGAVDKERETGSASAPPSENSLRNAYPPPMSPNSMAVAANEHVNIGMPSWGRRSDLTDESLSSATPPPIMRNPNQRGGGSASTRRGSLTPGLEDMMDEYGSSGAPLSPQVAVPPQSPAVTSPPANTDSPGNGGRKRGWLGGLGRVGSLRNRAG
ncbi:hypothetical protein MCOR11_003763 [Pyricularia oryzae]|nr:hypothetical protein MCOR11_003763 [Pyricularia oryzae]